MSVPSTHWKTLLGKAAQKYSNALWAEDNEDASSTRAYLTNRGLTTEALNYFRIGLVAQPAEGHETYTGRLCIPYITRSGIVTLRFRSLDGAEPKYMSLTGDKSRIFNTRAFNRPEETLIITEGEIDCITVSMCGYPAIGLPGAKTWRNYYAPLFEGRQVIIVSDNDDHGEGRRFAEKIREDLPEARNVICPKGHDLNSLFVDGGKTAVYELIEGN